ncbi:hypothetical protein [Parageobacillus thermoglucosidasius]|uniref:hypothetical protein n=1 Tax=Parageobacillus thermoglucosidasius TaxID=1426 RepID=UPI0021176BDB|nr:hypothetical protein [Parageobacillus thermoglucosidasius]
MKRQRSSLSTYSKWRIEWRKARPNCTLIVISHRIASLDWLERYLVIEHGKIVGTTSYEEMINKIEKVERAGRKERCEVEASISQACNSQQNEVKIAVIDSGENPYHSHINEIDGGIALRVNREGGERIP